MADKKSRQESVLVICAHSDDQIFGVGGTLAKYASEGKEITIIVLSYGEKSHPWLKKKVTIEMRVKESQEAAKVIGAHETIFFGVEEGKFLEQIQEKNIGDKIRRIIRKKKPSRIFTHSPDDPLPDHSALSNFVQELLEKIKFKGHLYSFDVWNPVKIKGRNLPMILIDISDTFGKKIEALRCFKSQKMAMISLFWSVYYRALKYGFQKKCRYAEAFYKLR